MNPSRHAGFSMIEVLVTLVVMSFGFLSLLSLQMATLNNLSVNNQNQVAMSIASGMGERLRANRASIAFYHDTETKAFTKNCAVAGACTIIEQDVWEFKQAIESEGLLPAAEGTIQIVDGLADITISWQEKDNETFSYVMQVPL